MDCYAVDFYFPLCINPKGVGQFKFIEIIFQKVLSDAQKNNLIIRCIEISLSLSLPFSITASAYTEMNIKSTFETFPI